MKYFLLYLICFLLLFSIAGCGTDSEDEQLSTPEENIRNGWEKYRSGSYGPAILAFERALSEDGSHLADAYNGLGWAYLGFSQSVGVNQKNLETSLSKFQEAIIHDRSNADAWVGQAGLLLIRRGSQDDFRNALKAIDNALQGNSEYLYRHDYDSETDLHVLKVQCYYYLGELNKAKDEVNRALAVEKNNDTALVMKNLLY